jgi:hypothetical protein
LENQAAAKQTFGFPVPLTSKRSAKRTIERCKRGFASATNICEMEKSVKNPYMKDFSHCNLLDANMLMRNETRRNEE